MDARPTRMTLPTLALLAAVGLPACDTVREIRRSEEPALAILLDQVLPPNPEEVYAGAFSRYDADERRASVATLIEQPYGGITRSRTAYRLLLGFAGDSDDQFTPDPDPTVRAIACKGLGIHGEPADAAILLPRLTDESAIVRYEAAVALQKLHHPPAAPALITLVTGDTADPISPDADADADVRAAAADALGQYADPSVFNALVAALFDADFGVVAAAHRSLVTLTGQTDLTTSPDDWFGFRDAHPGALFADQIAYRFHPYPARPGWLDYAMFWKQFEYPVPTTPTGLAADE